MKGLKKGIPMPQMQRVEVPIVSSEKLEFTPVDDLLLAERVSMERTAGGVIIPEKAREGGLPRYRVLKVGPGRQNEKGEIVAPRAKPGDVVLLSPNRGNIFGLEGFPGLFLAEESTIIAHVAEVKAPEELQ